MPQGGALGRCSVCLKGEGVVCASEERGRVQRYSVCLKREPWEGCTGCIDPSRMQMCVALQFSEKRCVVEKNFSSFDEGSEAIQISKSNARFI